MLTDIAQATILADDLRHPGETRADGAVPSHPNALRLSRNVWMLLFGSRKFTGTDDDRSIHCQLRRGQVDGPVIRERVLAPEREGWDPFGCGDNLCKIHGTPTGFGVPKGAVIHGRPAPHANVFMAKWYTYPKQRIGGRNANVMDDYAKHATAEAYAGQAPRRLQRYIRIECLQFRLNAVEDDIEVLQEASMLKQRGFEDAELPCEIAAAGMNHSMLPPQPADSACEEWLEVDHFGGNFSNARLAAVLYRFSHEEGLYEWVRTGPLTADLGDEPLYEATLNRVGDDWVVCARSNRDHGQTAWFRVADPLHGWPEPTFRETPQAWAPRSTAVCADGVLRIFGNDYATSPYAKTRLAERNPLCCWDVDLGTLNASRRRVILDSRAAGLPLRFPFVDAAKLLPAGAGRQLLGFRVLTPCKWHQTRGYPALTRDEFSVCGQYAAEIRYDTPIAEPWEFSPLSRHESSL